MRKLSLILILLLSTLILVGCSGKSVSNVSTIPSGKDCGENIAYLQTGVDSYKKAFGNFPVDLNKLAEVKDGKGPFVEVVPKCPTGNLYAIQNGKVIEVHK